VNATQADRVKGYRELLQLSDNATPTELQHHYRRQMRQWHPDHAPVGQGRVYEERAKLLNEARDYFEAHPADLRVHSVPTTFDIPTSAPVPAPWVPYIEVETETWDRDYAAETVVATTPSFTWTPTPAGVIATISGVVVLAGRVLLAMVVFYLVVLAIYVASLVFNFVIRWAG